MNDIQTIVNNNAPLSKESNIEYIDRICVLAAWAEAEASGVIKPELIARSAAGIRESAAPIAQAAYDNQFKR